MKTVKIHGDASITSVPVLITFQSAPGESFEFKEQISIQMVDNEGQHIGIPEIRSVVKTHDTDGDEGDWYEAYIHVK